MSVSLIDFINDFSSKHKVINEKDYEQGIIEQLIKEDIYLVRDDGK